MQPLSCSGLWFLLLEIFSFILAGSLCCLLTVAVQSRLLFLPVAFWFALLGASFLLCPLTSALGTQPSLLMALRCVSQNVLCLLCLFLLSFSPSTSARGPSLSFTILSCFITLEAPQPVSAASFLESSQTCAWLGSLSSQWPLGFVSNVPSSHCHCGEDLIIRCTFLFIYFLFT